MQRNMPAIRLSFPALALVALSAGGLEFGTGPAQATPYCVELTASEFNYSSNRRGDESACAGDKSDIAAAARDRARDNASNAIASQCIDRVTSQISRRACKRVNMEANAQHDGKWTDTPPAAKSGADKVRYIGRATGGGPGLCVVAHDVSFRTRSVVDGKCGDRVGLQPHRNVAIARARARCAVVCGAP